MNIMTAQDAARGQTRSTRRVLVIFNPNAAWRKRRRDRFNMTLRHIQKCGCKWEVRETDGPGDAWQMARDAAAGHGQPGGYDTVVAAGGDGTINEVIRGLDGSQMLLGIIPLGTANVLAREIGLVKDPDVVAEVIARAEPAEVCLGEVNGTPFAIMAGCGFDAHVCAEINLTLKKWTGKFAYVWQSLKEMTRAPDASYRVTVDQEQFTAASVIVANGRHYAGKFFSAPDARIDDPVLYAVLFERPGRWSRFRYVLATLSGRHTKLDDVRIVGGSQIQIEGAASEPVQIDGDITTGLPVLCRISPYRLNLLRPAGL